MLTTYYQEDDVTISWDFRNGWIHAHWRNIPSRETVKRGCEETHKLLVLKRASLVLSDSAEIAGAWGASSWVAAEWFPQMIAAGLKKYAWIQSPASVLSVISARRSETNNPNGVIRLFHDTAEAEKWLKS